MKKALTKALLLAMTIVTLAAIIPLSANASTSNKQKIYSFLTNEMDLNSAAACGILANIERESDFNPKLVIRDSNGLHSGGLCQWNGGRFSNLKKYCEKYGYNYLSIDGQMNYLKHELSQNSYNYIYDYLKDVSNTSDGAYDAAYYWCYYFEIPANRSVKAKQRGENAKDDYWPLYGNKIPSKSTLSFKKNTKTYDVDDAIGLKWTSAGKNCTSYKIYIVKKNSETKKYDWDNCKTYNVSSGKTSFSIPKNTLKTGSYKIKIRAINDTTGEYKDSNYIYCKIKCETHSNTIKITKQPTFTSQGKKLYTCKQCGYKTTKTVSRLTVEDFKEMKMTKPRVSSTTTTAIRLRWDEFAGATGYCVYQRVDGKWKLLGKVSADDELTYRVKNLKVATEYKFAVRAYTEKDGKTYKTKYSSSVVSSTETNVPEISVKRGTGSCKVSWNKVSGADGYQVYAAVGENSKNYKKVASVSGKTLSYTMTGLKKNQYYNYKVRSYTKCSNGTYVYSEFSDIKYIIAR